MQSRLESSPYLALRSIRCWEDAEGLHLRGHLPSYYLKQMAQETAFQADRYAVVINEIEVEVNRSPRSRRGPHRALTRPESLGRAAVVDPRDLW